jgi:hypothetical protein
MVLSTFLYLLATCKQQGIFLFWVFFLAQRGGCNQGLKAAGFYNCQVKYTLQWYYVRHSGSSYWEALSGEHVSLNALLERL